MLIYQMEILVLLTSKNIKNVLEDLKYNILEEEEIKKDLFFI